VLCTVPAALLAAGVAICASRVLAGDHWASDVIAGWMLGWLATLALSRFRYFA